MRRWSWPWGCSVEANAPGLVPLSWQQLMQVPALPLPLLPLPLLPLPLLPLPLLAPRRSALKACIPRLRRLPASLDPSIEEMGAGGGSGRALVDNEAVAAAPAEALSEVEAELPTAKRDAGGSPVSCALLS